MPINPALQAADHVPFWLEELRGETAPPPSQPLPPRAKWLIIGAGLAGCTAAYEFTQRGEDPAGIVLLDAVGPGWGATGRNGGFVLSNCGVDLPHWLETWGEEAARTLFKAALRNRELVWDFVQEHNVWNQQGGSFYICGSPSESTRLATARHFIQEWADEPWLWFDICPEYFPYNAGYIHQNRDFGINSVEYLLAMLRASGVGWVRGVAETSDIDATATGVSVKTSDGEIVADKVIIATNAYAPWVADVFGSELKIQANRNQVLVAEIEGESTNATWNDAIYYANEGYEYWRQLPDGRLLLGGGRNRDIAGEATWDYGTNRSVLQYLEKDLLPKLVQGRKTRVLKRWSGILGFSRDHFPWVGYLPGSEKRVSFIVGFSGHGLGTHRIAGEALSKMLFDREPPGFFDPRRTAVAS